MCAAFLVVGLWPFAFTPENGVHWIAAPAGLRFQGTDEGGGRGAGGLAFTPHPLLGGDSGKDGSFTIELTLCCRQEPRSSVPGIALLCDPSRGTALFLGQWKTSLIARRFNAEGGGGKGWREAGIGDVLVPGRTRFITVASSASESVFYVDGELEKRFPRVSLLPSSGSLRGLHLLLGNAPQAGNGWTGEILGVAIHDRFLHPDEVMRNFLSWKEGRNGPEPAREGLLLRYTFEEGEGGKVLDHSGWGNDLLIPPTPKFRSRVLAPIETTILRCGPFLEDSVINIAGFIPFGFFLCNWLAGARRLAAPLLALAGVLAGGSLSLFIELVQSQIPVRTSSVADLINNTLGAGLGVLLYVVLILPRSPSCPHREKRLTRMPS